MSTTPHIIHCVGGRLSNARPGSTTSPEDVRALVAAALALDKPELVLHFHGGLVSQAAGRKIAGALAPEYEAANRYPIFFVWEAGLIESIKTNLGDILQDKVFQQGIKKVTRWLLMQLPAAAGLRGAGAVVDVPTLEREYDEWFAGTRPTLPSALQPTTDAPPVLRSATDPANEAALAVQVQIALEGDAKFKQELRTIHDAIDPAAVEQPRPKATGVGATVSNLTEVSPTQVEAVFSVTPNTKGVFSTARFALLIAKLVRRVVVRFRADRDHGLYTTIVEELLAAVYVDKVGGIIWRQMKKDTFDAFDDAVTCAGAALVREIAAQQQAAGKHFKRIVLIGHSTGAVFICNFLDHCATALPEAEFDIVFLAPAVSYIRLQQTLARNPRVRNVRRFGMSDVAESKDVLVPIVYPRSLLYFVSGMLEFSDSQDPVRVPDMPLVGMQRFCTHPNVFTPAQFPDIAAVEAWLQGFANPASTWSLTDPATPPGRKTQAQKHGDFDNDPETVASLRNILANGYT